MEINKRNFSKIGKKNPQWKGDKVGYTALHEWIKNRKPKPKLCERCKKNKVFDLANISGKYKRDVNDFEWLCRSCHMKEDGRMDNLHKTTVTKEYKIKRRKEYNKKYCEEHKEERKEIRRRYYKKHREEIKEKRKIFYQINKDKILKRSKEWYKEHREEQIRYNKNLNKITNKHCKKCGKLLYYRNKSLLCSKCWLEDYNKQRQKK